MTDTQFLPGKYQTKSGRLVVIRGQEDKPLPPASGGQESSIHLWIGDLYTMAGTIETEARWTPAVLDQHNRVNYLTGTWYNVQGITSRHDLAYLIEAAPKPEPRPEEALKEQSRNSIPGAPVIDAPLEPAVTMTKPEKTEEPEPVTAA